MQLPLEISYRGIEKSPELERRIRDKADKLSAVCPRLSSCRIAVERPQEHQHSGSPYRVRIDMTVPPGKELVVRREAGKGEFHDDLIQILNASFQAARRRLQGLNERQRGEVKAHPNNGANGVVDRLLPDEDCGFIKDSSSRQIYFHRHSVTGGDYPRLEVGTAIRFVEESGEEGPQATTVQIRGKLPHSPVV